VSTERDELERERAALRVLTRTHGDALDAIEALARGLPLEFAASAELLCALVQAIRDGNAEGIRAAERVLFEDEEGPPSPPCFAGGPVD
jgi:hypothetical protein